MIGVSDVESAQQAWGAGIVAIACTQHWWRLCWHSHNHVNNLYAYQIGHIFKPTLAIDQFRPTFDTALSYFVASNNACPEDKGFQSRVGKMSI